MEPWSLDATAQAELVATGAIGPAELAESSLSRIEALNPFSGAVVATFSDQALTRAHTGLSPGPFHGVPLLLKDLAAWPDGVTAMGSRAFAGARPTEPPLYVQRLVDAGFNVIGKTHTPELGLKPLSRSELYGDVRNPWSPDRDAGGSSGGAAAAVALGMAAVAQGGDAGGSLRIPASACGVFGFKPSRGRGSPLPGMNIDGFVNHHVLTRSVRDSEAILDLLSPNIPGDRWTGPAPTGRERAAQPLRIAVTACGYFGHPVATACQAAVEDAARLCASLGHVVDAASPSLDGEQLLQDFLDLVAISAARAIDGWAAAHAGDPAAVFEADTLAIAARARGFTPWAQMLRFERFQAAAYAIARFQTDWDILLTPVLSTPPAPLAAFREGGADVWERLLDYAPHSPLANATGQPSMSVPLGHAEGLPIGVMATGRIGDERLLFELAYQLEEAAPWRDRRPAP